MKYIIAAILFISLLSSQQVDRSNDPSGDVIPIIPRPVSMTMTGDRFVLDNSTVVVFDRDNERLRGIAGIFMEEIEEYTGINLHRGDSKTNGSAIFLVLADENSLPKEGYRLVSEKTQIRIASSNPEGIFHGLQTLKQLILCSHPEQGEIELPGLAITDYPRFEWRGMHLDVCRHFFPVDSIKRFIDFLALYKFNKFHWHLTDDQGWRVEILKYPGLTSVGAWRHLRDSAETAENLNVRDNMYGGFYTQDEIREIVKYAEDRYVTIVPEIEMPGHCQAAIASYPEFGVTGKPVDVLVRWGISPNIYMPSEKTFSFLEEVLDEVMGLFPSEYIHIGGDEVIKDQWETSPDVQALIKKLGLKDEEELQSWFISRIGKYLADHGRRFIGWDEIMDGGISDGATVMSWRGEEGGLRAAQQNHDAIMSPNTYLYLNFSQTENEPVLWVKKHITPLSRVYQYDPVSPQLNEGQAKHIIGAQGCVWTEHISNFKRLEHMIFPRITALSEVLWSDTKGKEFDNFNRRLQLQTNLFNKMKINFFSE